MLLLFVYSDPWGKGTPEPSCADAAMLLQALAISSRAFGLSLKMPVQERSRMFPSPRDPRIQIIATLGPKVLDMSWLQSWQ